MKETNKKTLEEIIRVDHAGERGAIKIYEGQLLALNTFRKDEKLKKLIEEEQSINVLVLAANIDEKEANPGPIINSLLTKELTNFRIPIMIVPGNFSKEHISHIT